MKIFVRPKDGVKVRDPITMAHIPELGASVERTSYWLRRIKDGDVSIVPPVPPPKPEDEDKEELKALNRAKNSK